MECWSTPLQWLCKVARYWQELEHADPERHKHAQWVTYPVSLLAIQELGHFSFQELCAYPCNMGPFIMQQPELMVVGEWLQDLVRLFLCINKRHLCLSTYTCPCRNSIHKPLANTTPYTLKSALSSENQDSSIKGTPLQSARSHQM